MWFISTNRSRSSYHSLNESLEHDEKTPMGSKLHQPNTPRSHQAKAIFLITGAIIGILFVALCCITTLYLRLLHQKAPSSLLDCGSTVEEAKARGCIFDELLPAWMPPSCPQVGTEEFIAAGREWESNNGTSYPSWRYFEDKELKREISIEKMADLAQ